jgi:phenylacetate-CoA ligase
MPVLKNFLALRNEQWLEPEKLKSIQERKLEEILSSAARTKYYQGIQAHDFGSMAFTEKTNLQGAEHSFLSRAPGGLQQTQTSGSTGRPVKLFIDQETMDYRVAMKYMVETEFGLRPTDLFAEISHRSYVPHPLLRYTQMFRRIHLSVFEDETANFSLIRDSGANVLGWYPSAVSILAGINQSIGNPVRLKSVYCGSEILSAECRKAISDSFSCSVFNQYGAEEFGTIAWECPEEHSLHINSNSLLLEIIGSNGKPKESGSGEVAITTLHNKAMPLLRYKIGDYGSLGGECPCGRGLPVLKTLEGRSNDFIVLPSGKKRTPVSIDIMYGIPGVISYQIVQERPDLFVFRHVPSNGPISESSRSEVLSRIRKATLGEKITVEFEEVGKIPKTANGKISTVISKVKT